MKNCILLISALLSFSALSSQETFRYEFEEPGIFGDEVRLKWTIEAGSTCQGMRIYHGVSLDSLSLDTIYNGVCGDPNFSQTYIYWHESPAEGEVNYYQIVFGRVIPSNIQSILYINLGLDDFKYGPNPFRDSISFFQNESNEPVVISIFDLFGNRFFSDVPFEGNRLDLDLGLLPYGNYLFTVSRDGVILDRGNIQRGN